MNHNNTSKIEIESAVNDALASVRSYLHQDGGDVSLVEVSDDLVVKIRLHGNCKDCSMKIMTMKAGIVESIKRTVPQVKEVIEVA
jgi:Fe-S cluster biogenesis protein NfuA